jgi:hypothetical protein
MQAQALEALAMALRAVERVEPAMALQAVALVAAMAARPLQAMAVW